MRRQGADALIVDDPADAAVRETGEATDVVVAVVGLSHSARRAASDHFTHRCRVLEGSPRPLDETLDVRRWPIGDVPAWHADHRERVREALAAVPEGSGTSGTN